MISLPTAIEKLLRRGLLLLLTFYRATFAVFLGGNCRFEPSCSQYAGQAFSELPLGMAFRFSFKRVCKCHPWGEFGFDPVPSSAAQRAGPNLPAQQAVPALLERLT